MGGSCGLIKGRRGANRILVGKPERKRSLGTTKYIWENNFKMDLQEVDYNGMDSIDPAKEDGGRLYVRNEHAGSIKCGKFLD
jgi:hypothetical protein